MTTDWTLDDEDRAPVRTAGVSAILVGALYPVIIALFVMAGADMPTTPSGEAWLRYVAGKEPIWWSIVGLSALTDVLWIPVAGALYVTLKSVHRTAALWGAGLMVLFVALELSASWPCYAVLIGLSDSLTTATTDAERTAIVAAATFAASVMASPLLVFYAIFVPALGKLAFGFAMMRGGPFSRTIAILSIVAGALGVVSSVGRLFWQPLAHAIVLGSLIAAVWYGLVGLRMLSLAKRPSA